MAAGGAALLVAATAHSGRALVDETYMAGPCGSATAKAVLAPASETGTRLVVHGRVFAPDGATPVPDVIVYAYQTDARGYYSERRGEPPRLRAWVRTDRDGRFTLETIRPAAYPGRTVPAHIHFLLWGRDRAPQWNTELLFDDDPLVSERQREESGALGTFAFVHRLDGRAGGFEVSHNIRLKPAGDSFEAGIMHGLEPCRAGAR